jgi:hypothetical protein
LNVLEFTFLVLLGSLTAGFVGALTSRGGDVVVHLWEGISFGGRRMTNVCRLNLSLALLLSLVLADRLSAQQAGSEKQNAPVHLALKPADAEPQDDELRKLLKARYNEALDELKERSDQLFLKGIELGGFAQVFDSANRFVRAGLELREKPAERVEILTQVLELARTAEKLAQSYFNANKLSSQDLHYARYSRLDIEIQLSRARRNAQKAK